MDSSPALPRFDADPFEQEDGDVLTLPSIGEPGTNGSEFRVVLYNDDFHGMDEVVEQLIKATGCTVEKAVHIMIEAHTKGRAVCFQGERAKCHEVARILREIRLQCEVDCD